MESACAVVGKNIKLIRLNPRKKNVDTEDEGELSDIENEPESEPEPEPGPTRVKVENITYLDPSDSI